MRNETTVLALIVLVLTMGFSFAFTPDASPAEVNPGQSIQQAINEANTGDTILVGSGIYYENIVVNKTVVLEGEGWTTTIVDGMGAENQVFLINADNVVVRDLMIRNTSIDNPAVGYGIHIFGANNVTIANCKTTLCYYGIRLTDTNQSDVVENLIEHNYGYGISLHGNSSSNQIAGNDIENNPTGIYIASLDCKDNIVFHNNFENTNRNAQTLAQETVWDDYYPSGGNYWSDYVGSDASKGPEQDLPGSDGIGDTPYFVNGERDRYPFMNPYAPSPTYTLAITATAGGTTDPDVGTYNYTVNSEAQVTAVPNIGFSFDYWLYDGGVRTENPITTVMDANHALQAFFVDDIWPDINTPIQEPAENVEPYQNVTITVNVTDFGTGVHNVTLWHSSDNGTTWVPLNMLGTSVNTYQETIPGYGNCTVVTYRIVAYDNEGNQALNDNNGYLYGYHVVPEFSSAVLLVFLVVTFIITVVFARRKSPKKHS
jgi:parallel beta-helix repeat protein